MGTKLGGGICVFDPSPPTISIVPFEFSVIANFGDVVFWKLPDIYVTIILFIFELSLNLPTRYKG